MTKIMDENVVINISEKKLKQIIHDPEKTAKAIHLVYVSDNSSGITRKKSGKNFSYFKGDEKVKDSETLERIKKLVIPPAWENVWICNKENGHLQATGIDVKNRKQYKYHTSWNALRNHTKFYRMIDFGKALPQVREQLDKDLSSKELNEKKILATVVSLMERTNIRIGNNIYEKLYGSFGLTTMKNKHVKISGNTLLFSFKGKKGVEHIVRLKNKKLANIVQKTKEIPGKELFQYFDDAGNKKPIDSGMLNEYIREISGSEFTAKDFRTWAGTVNAFLCLNELGIAENETEAKKNVVVALDKVAAILGNTRTVCKKYYIHPGVFSLYESKEIDKYFKKLDKMETGNKNPSLTSEEKVIMSILENAYHQ
ncbi:MAG: DNA topoisomerase IB [Ferruginibacter sp.]